MSEEELKAIEYLKKDIKNFAALWKILEAYHKLIKLTGKEDNWVLCDPINMWSEYFVSKDKIKPIQIIDLDGKIHNVYEIKEE